MTTTYKPTVPHSRLLKAAAELIQGITTEAKAIVAENPNGSNATWAGVFRKLIRQATDISLDRLESPAFTIFAEDGNSKLPFAAFSSMAVLDCPARGACESWCYSKSAWRNPNAAGRQISNSMLLRSDAGRDLITKQFATLKGKVLRLYVDGDFHSQNNLRFWMDLLKTRPEVACYGYSKSWEIFIGLHLSRYEFPANYILNLSGGSKYDDRVGDCTREIMMQLPITRGIFAAYQVPRHHMTSKAYQSKRNEGHAAYAADVRKAAGKRVFVCAGRCGDCLPDGTHACGSDRFRGIEIAIGIH
jgi:hypothetical protein